MPFQLSPGVAVVEKDYTSIVPAVSSSTGAFAGAFPWGPVMAPTMISSENELVRTFGKPSDLNATSFFTAANFLSYTNSLMVVRADSTLARNAVATQTGTVTSVTMTAGGTLYDSTLVPTVTFSAPGIVGGATATGTAVMSGGSITAAAVGNGGSGYTSAPTITFSDPQVSGGVRATGTASVSGGAVTSITITSGGSGYTSAPTISFGGPGTNASAGTITISTSTVTGITITNPGSGYTVAPTVTVAFAGSSQGTQWTATTAVSLNAYVYFSGRLYQVTAAGTTGSTGPTHTSGAVASGSATLTYISAAAQGTAVISVGGLKINNNDVYSSSYINGEAVVGEWAARFPGAFGNSLTVSMADSASFAAWTYKANFDAAPSTSPYATGLGGSLDELHVVVVDSTGAWTGTAGTVLEKYAFVSKASDAKKSDGTNNYYKDVINGDSKYIYWMDHTTAGTNWGNAAQGTTFATLSSASILALSGGVDGISASAPTAGQIQSAYALFADDATYDISLVLMGKADAATTTYVIGNVAETRLDCVVFASPQNTSTGAVITGNGSDATTAIIAYRNALPSSSYAVLDSGYKYQYDRYNDKYRWIPLNGDIAGLCARTDYTNDPWFSPGGLNRGQIKSVVKLAINPTKTDRDTLYKSGVNPVVTFPGQGTVLYGDKTLLSKPSAFDRINVRRLFIVMEKAIATAAKYQLFEFNDGFTRAQFKNLIEPFLRDVQGRRGITDFRVKCDESNNTGEVIDSNQFVADIFVKPNRSINFITLNFVAARSGINFTEVGA